MKVVMLCDAFFEGLHYQENMLVKYYLKNQIDVVIIAGVWDHIHSYYQNNYNKNLEESVSVENNLTIIKRHYKYNFFNKIRFFKDITSILVREKPDVIYAHNIQFNLHDVVRYKKRVNPTCRIITDCHADYSNSGKNWLSRNFLHKVVRRIYLKCNLRYIDKIFPITPASFTFLKELYHVKSEMMELLPLGVDTDLVEYYKKTNAQIEVRKKLGIQNDDIVIITAGKLNPSKKTDQLIKAVKRIDNPNIRLLIAGGADNNNPDYMEHLKTLAADDRRIVFLGWLSSDEVVKYFSVSDIAVFPASQSVLWQEAIGAGLALVIGKYVRVNNKIIEQDADYLNREENILILNELDDKEDEIMHNLIRLIYDKNLLDKMKRGSNKVAEDFLSYDLIVKQTLSD